MRHLSLNIDGNPENSNAFFLRGQANFIFEQYESSLEDYEEAVRLGIDNDEAAKPGANLAVVFTSKGGPFSDQDLYWPAISEFNRAIRTDSQYPIAYRERGRAYRELGLVTVAMGDFEDAVRLDPFPV